MKYKLDLNKVPDGYGYYYGQLHINGEHYNVNIMPPISEWRGQLKMDGAAAPHPTDWVIFLDGDEIARVRKREDIEAVLMRKLPSK